MSIGFYDYDLYLKPNKVLLNLEAMKIAAYYNNLGNSVILANDLTQVKEYEKFYIFRNLPATKVAHEKEITTILSPNITHSGLAYSGGIYTPMEQKLEVQTAYTPIYAPYLREKIINGKLTFAQVESLLNSHFLRLRAGEYETDLTKLKRKDRLYIYDYEIEKVTDWQNKLLFARQELMKSHKNLRVWAVNGFKFTSFESVQKLTTIPGFTSEDVHLIGSHSYSEFQEQFKLISAWVSSRSGIKYSFGHDINPNSEYEVIKNLCLSINKYFYTKSILKACEFVVDDQCEVSSLNKLQKDFQYWTGVRIGDQTLKEYFISRNKKTFDNYLSIIAKTPYKGLFEKLCGVTKNNIKKVGWYYHD